MSALAALKKKNNNGFINGWTNQTVDQTYEASMLSLSWDKMGGVRERKRAREMWRHRSACQSVRSRDVSASGRHSALHKLSSTLYMACVLSSLLWSLSLSERCLLLLIGLPYRALTLSKLQIFNIFFKKKILFLYVQIPIQKFCIACADFYTVKFYSFVEIKQISRAFFFILFKHFFFF